MKKLLILFVAFTVCIVAAAQTNDTPYITKSLSSDNIREVLAKTSGGGIYVSGVKDGEARIEVYVRSNDRDELSKAEIKEKLEEDYDLTLSVSGNKLTAIAEPKSNLFNWKQQLNISFRVFVPQNVSTDLHTSGGGIELTNLSGTHNFSTSGGGLELNKLNGKVNGKTSGGGISVADSGGDIRLSTSGGGIDASNCTGQITLNTSGGPIDLTNLDGTIEAKTSGGSVRGREIKGELTASTSGGNVALKALSCSVDAFTSGGNMEIEINQLGKYVTVSNSGGNINLLLPGNKGLDLRLRGNRIRTTNLNNFSGDHDDDKITGKINGGGVMVSAQTSGTISVTLR